MRIPSLQPTSTLIVTTIAVTLAAAALGWGYWQLARRVNANNLERREIELRIAGLEEERRNARNLASLLDERRLEVSRINRFFIDRDRPIAFIEDIERLAAATDNIVTIDIDEEQSDERNLGFQLTLEGSQVSILNYVRLFELAEYKIAGQELAFQKSAADAAQTTSAGRPAGRLLLTIRARAR